MHREASGSHDQVPVISDTPVCYGWTARRGAAAACETGPFFTGPSPQSNDYAQGG